MWPLMKAVFERTAVRFGSSPLALAALALKLA
jgi:hypothetical protein